MTTLKHQTTHGTEVEAGQRFEFGENWKEFLQGIDDAKIAKAIESLQRGLNCTSLQDKTFLDIGCGSGLFSLAAKRLGANVLSLDFDPHSVACAQQLKRTYYPNDQQWRIEEGSVLDRAFMDTLGMFDVVYSWGVLHHTGNMNEAIALAAHRVRKGGLFFIAVYNDQGGASKRWLSAKKIYNKLPAYLQPTLVAAIALVFEAKWALIRLARGRNPFPSRDSRADGGRGMDIWRDWVDWVGGLPFEVAKPEQIILPLRQRSFVLEHLTTCGGGKGCNEFVFRKFEDK